MKRIVILISGRGSNMLSILDAIAAGALSVEVAAVIANRPDAAGLDIARSRGISTQVVDHRQHADRAAFDTALSSTIDGFMPDLVVLAGFMRILTDAFVLRYAGKMMNIHPSLLPVFPGLHTHRRALEAGVRVHGCTVHFVTPVLDVGPIVAQAVVPVLANDDADSLAARVLSMEHKVYPAVVDYLARDIVSLDEHDHVVFSEDVQTFFVYQG